MAMKFKMFRKEEVSEEVINSFFADHIVHKDHYLENGDIYIYYNDKDDLEMETMDKLERVSAVIMKAKQEIFDASVGIQEEIAELEEIKTLIAGSDPNKGKEWLELQERRTRTERQIKLHQETISTRQKQIVKLEETYKTIIEGKELNIEVQKDTVKDNKTETEESIKDENDKK